MHFPGSMDQLQEVVAALGCPGHWSHEGAFSVYRVEAGEMINFWPATGVLQVQGHPERAAVLQAQLQELLSPPA